MSTTTYDHAIILPRGSRDAFDAYRGPHHPGLLLDKFCQVGSQEVQKKSLVRVTEARPDAAVFQAALRRWKNGLSSLNADTFTATTAGPLTLHLARAGALETAGLCLHPLYGFVYLPGSGLKGMARAWAMTDGQVDDAAIKGVFGVQEGAGAVVFHDAWPAETVPDLIVDIANNHHPFYYQKPDAPPGDWEDPVPINFLAVKPGSSFLFAVSARTSATDSKLVALARQWLLAALCHQGAGAKTAAGYGRFVPADGPAPALSEGTAARFRADLELVSPAFLAGAMQQAGDCDLRPATLRGLLRWWWRTLHVGHVDEPTLHDLEEAVWGSVRHGSPIHLDLRGGGVAKAKSFDKMAIKSVATLPQPRDRKTTQGLFYASYGMDEKGKRRSYLDVGSRWTLEVAARGGRFRDAELAAGLLLDQAMAALWLLTRYGGVGSKGRKGFGSLHDCHLHGTADLAACKRAAEDFRKACGIAGRSQADAYPDIEKIIQAEWTVPEKNCWRVLDRLGVQVQSFAKETPSKERVALGLPRKELKGRHPQTRAPLNRHASPIHFHLARTATGYAIRMAAFPSSALDGRPGSCRLVLERLKKELSCGGELNNGIQGKGPGGSAPNSPAGLTRPGSLVSTKWLYNEEVVTVIGERSDGRVDIAYEDGDPDTVLRSSLKPIAERR